MTTTRLRTSLFTAMLLAIALVAGPAHAQVMEREMESGDSAPKRGGTTGGNQSKGSTRGKKTTAGPRKPTLKWHTTWNTASAQARKEDKLILAYFTSSDWDDFSQKLWKEVLTTEMFEEWAAKNVVLFEVDFPVDKKQNMTVRMQNDRIKQQHSVTRVPTLIFMDADGEGYVRAGYDTACLRKHEKKGQPLEWIKFADNAVKARPGLEKLRIETNFAEASERSRKTGLPFLLLITKDRTNPRIIENNKALMNSQKFIRFVNRTMLFMPWEWPDDADTSAEAQEFRKFVETHKLGPAPVQIVMYFPGQKKIKLKITVFTASKVEALRKQLEKELPKFDYTGNWVEDFHVAQAIASQLKRELLVAFTSMDSSDWCQKMDAEIFKQREFREYAGKHLVLCRVDFPKTTEQKPDVAERNRQLAEVYGIRGYPTVVILNAGGQRIGNAKYQKGGPRPFLMEIDELRKRDYERRTLMSDEVEVVD